MKLQFFILMCFSFFIVNGQSSLNKKCRVALAIHGGAGNITRENLSPERETEYRKKLNEALDTGYSILNRGGKSVDAVEAVIRIMENSPLFNAGVGAVLTYEGTAELDASIMDGSSLNAGSVAGVSSVKNPITAAKAVMLESPHVMMAGKGAEAYARTMGLEMVDPSWFVTPEMNKKWLRMKQNMDSARGEYKLPETEKYGTVGCVALDEKGNIAAGTSTGGMMMKKFGRVGDSPIIGAGTYADNNSCAVSSTGHGEFFIRLGVAQRISSLVRMKKYSLQKAADIVIQNDLKALGGTGGVICINKKGEVVVSYNTPGMYRAYINSKGKREVAVF